MVRFVTSALVTGVACFAGLGASADVFQGHQQHDFRDRSPSEENTLVPSARTADDFESNDSKYSVHFVSFSMIVNWPNPPTQFAVDLYSDSGSGPGERFHTASFLWALNDRGPWNGHDDLHLFDVTIRIGGIRLGIATWWLSAYAIGDGSGRAWWGTAGNGVVNGSEGYFMSDHFGVPDWTPISESGILDFPTDFAFTLIPEVPGAGGIAIVLIGSPWLRFRRRRG